MSYGYQGQLFSDEQHDKLGAKLKDIHNGLQGYVELQTWVKEELGVEADYFNLRKYVKKHFGTKVKRSRKSHVKKYPEAVASLRPTR